MVNMSPCHGEDHEFESRILRQRTLSSKEEHSAHNRMAAVSGSAGSTKEKNGGIFMRANLDKRQAMEIAAKEGLEWEVANTFKNLKKQFGKKVADAILWSMSLDEWDL